MPRAGLSPEVVVAEAARLADEEGYDRLTLAALAARLGVAVPSLYKHVDGLDALRRGVAIVALRDLGVGMTAALAAADGAGGKRLRAISDAYRAYATAHPGRYAATIRAASPDDVEHAVVSASVMEPVLEVLAERGLHGDAAIDAARALRAALHGWVTLEAAGGFGMPRDIERSYGRMVELLDQSLGALGPVGELRLALTVEDFAGALRLYSEALGMPVVESWEQGPARGVVLAAGRATLELLSPEQADLVDGIEVGVRVAGPVRVALAVADSALAADALVAAGAERLGGSVVTPWAHRNVRVRMPDGLQLTLFTELPADT